MSKSTHNQLKALQGLKDRLIKQAISSLIKALFSMQNGNKKPLISLLFLLYCVFYGIIGNLKSLFTLVCNNWEVSAVIGWAIIAYKFATWESKTKDKKNKEALRNARYEIDEDQIGI